MAHVSQICVVTLPEESRITESQSPKGIARHCYDSYNQQDIDAGFQVAEGDKVATRWMVKGAQRSEFLGQQLAGPQS